MDAQGPPAKVLLYGEPSQFLERALSLIEGIEVSRAAEGAKVEPGYDVYILNGQLPDSLPEGNLLLMAPPSSLLLPVTGEEETLRITSQTADSLLLRFADLSTTSVASAVRMEPPEWMEVLASSGDVPVLAAGETDGRRVVAMAFSPESSDLPLQVAFPILIDNIIRYLGPEAAVAPQSSVMRGEPVQLPAGEVHKYVVRTPGGRDVEVETGVAGSVFTDTEQPGVYEVRAAGSDAIVSQFAVNAGSPNESRINISVDRPIATSGEAATPATESRGRERWWPLLAAALVVALLEWWVYSRSQLRGLGHRRATA